MWGGIRGGRIALAAVVCLLVARFGAGVASDSPRELYRALNDLRVDSSRVYSVRELHLRRDVVHITFSEGKLAFMAPFNGLVTGAVFSGRGRVIATPRDAAERRSMSQFLGVPLLDQSFSRAYIRFSDGTAAELESQLRSAGAEASSDSAFGDLWNASAANLNPEHSLRVLKDWMAADPLPYFYAAIVGDVSGPFDVLVDERRSEQVLFGQSRRVGLERFYDVWASFPRAGAPAKPREDYVPLSYSIETKINGDRSLEGAAMLRLRAARGGERIISLELSRFLEVKSAADGAGRPLEFFQNAGVSRGEIAFRGNDSVSVVLPEPVTAGQEFELRFGYRGNVISDAGNGVYFVGERGTWYPHVAGPDHFVTFDLTFRWPRRLALVATGAKVDEHEEGDVRVGRWTSTVPCVLLGFNLGEYARVVVPGKPSLELLANRRLENALLKRLRPPESPDISVVPDIDVASRPQVRIPHPEEPQFLPPSPASLLKQLGASVLDSIRFFEKMNGPFPFDRLEVSQIPGSFGQGYPGLLYLPTLVFLPPETQQRAGLNPQAREEFSELVPYHEVAHQWWGNEVGVETYRDTWIQEAMANYLALLYADSKRPNDHLLRRWLETYRALLTTKKPGQEEAPELAGPVTLGYRLSSSKTPNAYDAIIYGKGTWVIHMLRMMLRNPGARDPDARFVALLHSVLLQHRFQALSTDDLKRAVEQAMTPAMDIEGNHAMDWFFDGYVRGTGIPRYSVNFEVKPRGNEFLIRGTLKQSGVPDLFTAPVPLYLPGGKPSLLGTVISTGAETTFEFVSPVRPRRLLIDPQLSLLRRTD